MSANIFIKRTKNNMYIKIQIYMWLDENNDHVLMIHVQALIAQQFVLSINKTNIIYSGQINKVIPQFKPHVGAAAGVELYIINFFFADVPVGRYWIPYNIICGIFTYCLTNIGIWWCSLVMR